MENKIIKSTKWGRGIHSPFVYRLVTEIIFSKYPYYSFDAIKLISTSSNEKNELEKIFRLLNFFQPKEIMTVGDRDEKIVNICNWAIPKVKVVHVPDVNKTQENKKMSTGKQSFIIWNNYCNKTCFEFNEESVATIICRNLKDPQMRELFNSYIEKKEVRVSIELKYFGIAIINGKFQKQNYVINH